MEENNNIEERIEKLEKSNKKSIGVIVALVIIVLILCALLLMTKTNILSTLGITNKQGNSAPEVVDKDDKDKEKDKEEETTKEPEKIVGEQVNTTGNEVMKKLAKSNQCDLIKYFVSTTKLTASDIPGSVAFQLVLRNEYTPLSHNGGEMPKSIPVSDIAQKAKKYLGKNYTFVPEEPKECYGYIYNASTSSYVYYPGCGGTCGPETYSVNSENIQGDYLYVSVTNRETNYLFTFVNEDGNYIFVSSEPVAY